jgi:NAD(P)-dependent dehydrogenase (short-subunit alcohol dehydrogenase family)
VSAFYRPPPSEQASLPQVQALVRPDEFCGQRVLVVGGSRGLGEVVTKVLVAGGAEVAFTFARGRDEAAALQAALGGAGRRIQSLQLDVLEQDQSAIRASCAAGDYTHVYYFATPHIGKRPRGTWHQQTFNLLCAYYLDGFARLAELPELQRAVFCFPSTVYLEQAEAGFAEYCAAKAAGESLCRTLQLERGLRILVPRLERMRTDQTASVSGTSGADPLVSLVPVVRQVQLQGAS